MSCEPKPQNCVKAEISVEVIKPLGQPKAGCVCKPCALEDEKKSCKICQELDAKSKSTAPRRSWFSFALGKGMAPPTYADLGKDSRNVFGKGYHFGLIKLDCKTKTSTGVEFASGGSSNTDSGNVTGQLETTYKIKEYGLTFTEKWNTNNILATGVSISDYLAKGLKVTLDSTFAPQTGKKSAELKSEFKNDVCALNCDVDLDLAGPLVKAAAVFGYNGWLAGYQAKFDSQKSKLIGNNFALGYATSEFILHTNVDDGQEFGGSIYQKVSSNLDTGINLNWSANSNETRFGIGCKYDLDNTSSVRAKVNNASQVGLGFQQKIRDGVIITFSALIDGKNFNQGGHKLGVAIELEA